MGGEAIPCFFTIQHLSRINSEVKLLAETMIEEFRGNTSTTLIGVHVRRTDYKDLLGKKTPFNLFRMELHDTGLKCQ